MSSEYIPDIINLFLNKGALDAFITPIIMKKGRPAYILSVLCFENDIEEIERIFFENSSTIGLRKRLVNRTELERKEIIVNFSLGEVRVKIASYEGRIVNIKLEHDDVVLIADSHNISSKSVIDIFFKENEDISIGDKF